MIEEVNLTLEMATEAMQTSLVRFENELTKIRAGKATPSMLDSIKVDYYGSMVPLSQVATVGTLDARTLTIKPWEKENIGPIERGIINSNLGFAPQNNGESILINIPPLTEERRVQLVKQVKAEGENAKVSIRNARKEANDSIKKFQKDGFPEDSAKDAEAQVQKLTNDFIAKIDSYVSSKEADIMKV